MLCYFLLASAALKIMSVACNLLGDRMTCSFCVLGRHVRSYENRAKLNAGIDLEMA